MSGPRSGDQRARSIERDLRRKEFHMSRIMCELKATKKQLRERGTPHSRRRAPMSDDKPWRAHPPRTYRWPPSLVNGPASVVSGSAVLPPTSHCSGACVSTSGGGWMPGSSKMASLPPICCRVRRRLNWRSSVRGGCAERSVPSSAGSASSSRGLSSSSPSRRLPCQPSTAVDSRRGGRRWCRSARSGAQRSLGARPRQLETHRTEASPAVRWVIYALVGGAAAATVGPYLVLVLIACGVAEIVIRRQGRRKSSSIGAERSFRRSSCTPLPSADWVRWRGWRSRWARSPTEAGS